MADFDLFESLVTAESEDRVRRAANERALKEAAFDVRRQFGNYLANAESTMDYNERFSYLQGNIAVVLQEKVEPTQQVLAWLKQEFLPEHLMETEQHGKLARHGDQRSLPKTAAGSKQARDPRTVVGGVDWQWDRESNSFKSTKSSNFQCVCGSAVAGVGQHECNCGRLWNLSSIEDGNKTAAPPLYVCREVMRRDTHLANTTQADMVNVTNDCGCCADCTGPGCDCCKSCSTRKHADAVDPTDSHKHEKSDEWEYSDGYDVKGLIGPAAGEEEHDAHLSALDLIFAAEDDPDASTENSASDDSAGNVSAASDPGDGAEFPEDISGGAPPAPMGAPPMPPAQPSPMDSLMGDPAGMENQPAEDADIQQAQQAILDMILREKSEEVVNDENNDAEIDNLNDAYQSLDVVQDLENGEMMGGLPPMGMGGAPGPQLAAYQAGAKYGYVLGFLEALAESSYDDRKTDFEGFEPPIDGVSNGLDDADATPGKDTTDELRSLLKDQFDSDNAANKDQKPLDPATPFGSDKGKSSRFKARL